MSRGTCPYCSRYTAADICPQHGYVGAPKKVEEPSFPFRGVMVMYSGTIASIPQGWSLCDGTGGTPDLRDKFVMGAGSSYAVGATGGSNVDHSHTVTVATHAADVTVAGGAVTHSSNTASLLYTAGDSSLSPIVSIGSHPTHTHATPALAHSASSGTGSSIPAYYAAAYIMYMGV